MRLFEFTVALLVAAGIAGLGMAEEKPEGAPPRQGFDDWAAHMPEGRWGGARQMFSGRGFGTGGWDVVTSGPFAGFRQNMLNEFHNVPLLESNVKRALQIQSDRLALQRQRELIALSRSKPSAEILSEFHKLLQREDELTSAQVKVVDDLLRDSKEIQRQIEKRRNDLSARLEDLRNETTSPVAKARGDSETEMRRIRRMLRSYDFINENLGRLNENPKQAEWLRGFMRGMWGSEEIDMRVIEQARRRLQELEQEQDDLRHKMDTMNDRINELHETLDAAMKKH